MSSPCSIQDCERPATHGLICPLWCGEHGIGYMWIVFSKCTHYGCRKTATHGVNGSMYPIRCASHSVLGHINLVEQMMTADPAKKFLKWTPSGTAVWITVHYEKKNMMGYLSADAFHLYDE